MKLNRLAKDVSALITYK